MVSHDLPPLGTFTCSRCQHVGPIESHVALICKKCGSTSGVYTPAGHDPKPSTPKNDTD